MFLTTKNRKININPNILYQKGSPWKKNTTKSTISKTKIDIYKFGCMILIEINLIKQEISILVYKIIGIKFKPRTRPSKCDFKVYIYMSNIECQAPFVSSSIILYFLVVFDSIYQTVLLRYLSISFVLSSLDLID